MNFKGKGLLVIVGVLCIFSIVVYAVFRQLSDAPAFWPAHWQKSPPKQLLGDKKSRYRTGIEETITFFARENGQSSRVLARKAFLIRRPGAKATVFVFHGFMCNKNDIRFLTNSLFSQPFDGQPVNTITIDFRAHGEVAQGQCCSFGHDEKYDVMGVVEYVKSDPELKNTKRVAYGFSMGAVASLLAQADDPTLFDMAIWDCPFESTENIIGRAVSSLKLSMLGYDLALPGRSLLQRYAYNPYVQSWLKFALKTIAKMDATQVETCIVPIDTVEAAQKIAIPVMVIGCKGDEKVPVSAVRAIYDALKGYKRLWITNGRAHFDSYFYNPEKYIYKVRRFIQKAFDGTIKQRYAAYVTLDPDELE